MLQQSAANLSLSEKNKGEVEKEAKKERDEKERKNDFLLVYILARRLGQHADLQDEIP